MSRSADARRRVGDTAAGVPKFVLLTTAPCTRGGSDSSSAFPYRGHRRSAKGTTSRRRNDALGSAASTVTPTAARVPERLRPRDRFRDQPHRSSPHNRLHVAATTDSASERRASRCRNDGEGVSTAPLRGATGTFTAPASAPAHVATTNHQPARHQTPAGDRRRSKPMSQRQLHREATTRRHQSGAFALTNTRPASLRCRRTR